MKSYNLENVWICELSFVYRREKDNILNLYESNSKCVLIMKDEWCLSSNIVNIKGHDHLSEQRVYFDIEGNEYYHGTQKAIFNESDIGKIYVSERKPVPQNILTDEEKETQKISADRIEELNRRLQFHDC